MSNSNTHVTILPIEFSVGFVDSVNEDWIHRAIQKLDPHAYTRTKPRTEIDQATGKIYRSIRFCMIVQHGQERQLFFKLKLKYPEFKRHF